MQEVKSIITERISHFISSLQAEDIPQDAINLARLGVSNFIAVALAGSKEEQSKIVTDYARRMGGVPEASIIGDDFKTSPYLAALVNGTKGHALDYDDTAISLIGHPSVFLVPAILAIGETKGISGKDALAAYVVGYEVACCIAKPLLQSHYVQGWHSTATFGALGAAAAASWLLKLKLHQVRMALGIAASLAGGLRQNFGTMTKPLHAGRAAADGIKAAFLAQAGFTADDAIIEAPLGFARVFGHRGQVDWAKVGESLGETFIITSEVGLSIKPYPSCHFTHCGIDAALYIKNEHEVNVNDVAKISLISLGVSPFDKKICIHHRPKTGLEGKFSLEYCVARALSSGVPRLRHFTDEMVARPQINRLMEKMRWVERYPMPVMGTTKGLGTKSVTVKLKDGREFSREVTVAKGMPQNPLTPSEFNLKYRDCASVVLSGEDVERSLSLLKRLQKVNNVKEITHTITKK